MELKIVCKDDAYMPHYATELDACMDLKVTEMGHINPGETKVFGTGIQVAVPKDHVMLLFPRSSTGFKLNCRFANGTGIIDSGYRDEIKIALHNFGNKTVIINDEQRVAQFMVIPRPKLKLVQVEDDVEFRQDDRNGGIGSTGK